MFSLIDHWGLGVFPLIEHDSKLTPSVAGMVREMIDTDDVPGEANGGQNESAPPAPDAGGLVVQYGNAQGNGLGRKATSYVGATHFMAILDDVSFLSVLLYPFLLFFFGGALLGVRATVYVVGVWYCVIDIPWHSFARICRRVLIVIINSTSDRGSQALF